MITYTHVDAYNDAMELFKHGSYLSLMQAVLDVLRCKRYLLSLDMSVVLMAENVLPEPETATPDKRLKPEPETTTPEKR